MSAHDKQPQADPQGNRIDRETPQEAAVRAVHPLFHRMSGGAQRLLVHKYHPVVAIKTRRAGIFTKPLAVPAAPHAPGTANVRVNSPAEDAGAGNHTTESEPCRAWQSDCRWV